MGTTDGNGVYTPDLDEEGWDAEVATNFDLFSQNITDTAAHVADTTAAHAASAIAFTPTGTVAATNVQTAIAEVASEAASTSAPTTADYLVGTAQGGLSAEIVVGATPGGELGGTWASPTVDSSHAGGTHAATQTAAEATAASALTTHAAAADPHTGYRLESATVGTSDITNDAVTYAKIQNVSATSRVLGRVTAGAGDTEELTGTQVASLLPSKLVGTRTSVGSAISTTETVMVSGTILANTLAAGDTFKVEALGRGTTGVTPGTGTWACRIGPTTLTGNLAINSGALTLIASRTDKAWAYRAQVQVFTIGGSGTVQGSAQVDGRLTTNDFVSAAPFIGSAGAPVAIDTTVDNLIELTFVTSQAGSSAVIYNGSIVKV